MLAALVDTSGSSERRRIGGRYAVLEVLGRGGMATVYRVRDEVSGRELALKHADGGRQRATDERMALRFRREFHSLVELRHPRIVAAYDFGVDETGAFYTMESLDGADLKDLGALPWMDACSVLRDVAGALAFLHARGLVHRDLGPRNVRRTRDGHAKLFDFGLLASVGVAGDVAGTPTSVAPETLRGRPIDGRTDLWGLGTLAYWLLTGRHPYAVRKLAELEDAWRAPPPPPSAIVDGIPGALDGLVMELLSIDPLGRPSSAAEVIDRLGAVASLPRDPEVEVTKGYLASAAMVGRAREMALLRGCIADALAGRGRCVTIEATTGTGKSRLLHEVALEGQLAGLTVLEARGDRSQGGAYGVVQQLVAAAVVTAPERVRSLDRTHTSVVARLFPSIAPKLGVVVPSTAVVEPAEERLRILNAVVQWFIALAGTGGVALCVDDMQRCDEASAVVLAALARELRERPLLVVVTVRIGEPVRAPQAIASLGNADLRLRLQGLGTDEVEALVCSLFGAVPHGRRLALWLHERSSGSPLHCLELVRTMVDGGTIRFTDGMWLLPGEYTTLDVPPELSRAMEARVAGLDPDARHVAEVLAVLGAEVELASMVELADLDEPRTFAALDRLVARSIAMTTGDRHRFRHDGLREAVLRGIADERRIAAHRRIGAWLARHGESPRDDAAVGWHLHAGGETERGAELLATVGRRLFHAQALVDCVAPLEAALVELERVGRPAAQLLELRFMLVSAGWVSDRATGLRHMYGAVEAYRRHAGIAAAERIGAVVGRHLGLVLGIVWACLRWLVSRPSRRGPWPLDAIATFAVTVGYAAGMEYANHSLAGLQRLIATVEPLAVFRGRVLFATHHGLSAFPDLLMGRLGDAKQKLEHVLHILEHDRLTPIGEFERRFAEAGIRALIGQVQVTDLDPELDETLAAIRRLRLRYYDLVASTTEASALRFRGYERRACEIEAALESTTLQLGSWSTDVQMVLFGHPPYGAALDVTNLKRMVDALEQLVAQGFDYRARLAMTRGDLHRARGDPTAAIAEYDAALALLHPDEMLTRLWVWAGLAEAALDLGDAERAQQWACRAKDGASAPRTHQQSVRLRALRALALAHAARGELDDAERVAELACTEGEARGSAMAAGLAHEARARIALARGDHAVFRLHATEARRWLRTTGSPGLAAVGERIAEAANPVRATTGEHVAADGDSGDAVTSLSQLATSHELVSSPPSGESS